MTTLGRRRYRYGRQVGAISDISGAFAAQNFSILATKCARLALQLNSRAGYALRLLTIRSFNADDFAYRPMVMRRRRNTTNCRRCSFHG